MLKTNARLKRDERPERDDSSMMVVRKSRDARRTGKQRQRETRERGGNIRCAVY